MEILIALPFLALWIGALFAALGLLFAPVAAIYCRHSARQNGLNPRRYALMGGVYSCLFFVPAVFLSKEIRGKEVSRNAINRTYIVLYSYWAIGPVGLPLMLDLVGGGSLLWFVLFVIWVASIVRANNRNQEAQVVPLSIMSYAYITPFALAYLSSVVSIVFSIAGWV